MESSECLGKPFVAGSGSSTENEKMLLCLDEKSKVRQKRSTFLEYLFSNGERVDEVNNKLVEMGGILNQNIKKITSNELKLQIEEQLLSRDIVVLDKRLNYNVKSEAALALSQRRLDLTSLHANVYISAALNEMMAISKVKQDLTEFSNLMIDTMNQREDKRCLHMEGKFRCINFKKSNLNIKKHVVKMALYSSSPKAKSSNFISCLPMMTTRQISMLHNSHLAIMGEDYVGPSKVVKIRKLNDPDTVNAKTRDILEEDLVMTNIFVTTSMDNIILSCHTPELIMVATQQHNCTTVPLVLKKTPHFNIMTSKGVIEEESILSFKLESKEKFIREAHKILALPGKNFRFQPPSNISAGAQILERLSEFSTPELVGLSVGTGTMLITVFCLVGFCAWCCGIRNCPATHKESWTRSPPRTPTSEDRQQPMPLAARPAPTTHTTQPIREVSNPLVTPDSSDLLEDRTLDYLRDKVKSLSALKRL